RPRPVAANESRFRQTTGPAFPQSISRLRARSTPDEPPATVLAVAGQNRAWFVAPEISDQSLGMYPMCRLVVARLRANPLPAIALRARPQAGPAAAISFPVPFEIRVASQNDPRSASTFAKMRVWFATICNRR